MGVLVLLSIYRHQQRDARLIGPLIVMSTLLVVVTRTMGIALAGGAAGVALAHYRAARRLDSVSLLARRRLRMALALTLILFAACLVLVLTSRYLDEEASL